MSKIKSISDRLKMVKHMLRSLRKSREDRFNWTSGRNWITMQDMDNLNEVSTDIIVSRVDNTDENKE